MSIMVKEFAFGMVANLSIVLSGIMEAVNKIGKLG